ncbi:Sec-independent protein translocase protein TatB [Phenylobacterium sp.]|uniref:Sec-independent protein translocase protein TatB n=1 Tax=Phenylobacterium sp. TaxID=1871053 RepID=UPI0035B18617
MLPDIGASELLLIAVVALIIVGPKDLPILMRKVGQFVARLRGMAAEFRASFDEMARQSELDELRKEVEAMRSGRMMTETVTGATEPVQSAISEIEQSLADTGAQFHPPMSHQIEAARAEAPPLQIGVTPEPEAPAAAPKPARKPRAKPAASKAAPAPAKAKAPAAKPAAAKAAPAKAPAKKASTAKAAPARKPRAKKADA